MVITRQGSNLVTENLNLRVGSVDGSATAAVVAVGVNLDYEWRSLNALLWGEVCAQTVDWDEDLSNKQEH